MDQKPENADLNPNDKSCVFVCVFQLEMKVQQGERDFEQISKTIRKEVSRFEVRRCEGLMGGRGFKGTD